MKQISIVIPVYNEEDNVRGAHERVTAAMAGLADRYSYEILFTDNHSTDRTFEIIDELAQADPRVRCVRFSTNFGYQRSILTGYLMARGDAVVQLDADMQDPPEIIPAFLEKWEEGYAVVYGVRTKRQESVATTLIRKAFYRLINALSDDQLPVDAGDFRLVDRRIIEELRKYHDASPYIRGSIAAMGFRQIGIPYDRDRRTAGQSKFNFRACLSLAVDGILNHSVIPLRIASLVGFVTFLVAGLGAVVYLVGKLVFRAPWPMGFATTVLLLLFGIGLTAFFFGILGEYVGRIYLQVKQRPLTIVERTINMGESDDAEGGT